MVHGSKTSVYNKVMWLSGDVAFWLKTIYKSKANPPKSPEVCYWDKGNEFKTEVTKLL